MNNIAPTASERLQSLWTAQQLRPDEHWLRTVQRDAIEQFSRTGFPTTRLENWKYTDVSKLAEAYPEWLDHRPAPTDISARRPLAIEGAIHLVFIDGLFQPTLSSQELPANLLAGSLEQLAETHRQAIESRLGKLSSPANSAFTALNTAFTSHCTALLLPAETVIEQPVYIEHFAGSPATGSHPRLLVDLGANSKATIIEHFSGSAASLVNAVAEMTIGCGAQLSYYRLQDSHADAWHTAQQYLRLESDARVYALGIDSGAAISRNEFCAELAGPGATLEAQGLLLGNRSRHIDSRITLDHAAMHTSSQARYRSILDDKARGVFNGRILVRQAAQKTNAALTNRNLLLSRGAEINTKPELEIYADDVKCAHGSTTGQLDEAALFYLLSRGIDKEAARNMLVTAFASELLTGIEIPALAERVREALGSLRFSKL